MSNLTISDFFEHVLEAPLHCVRWSWGAVNPKTGEVFLRCWSDEVVRIDGQQYVQVQWLEATVNKNGRTERQQHLELVQNGRPGWLVVAHPKDGHTAPRKIAGYNSEWKYRLGSTPVEKDGILMLPILGKERLPSIHQVKGRAA